MRDIIEQWLWMQAMNTACKQIYQNARRYVEFNRREFYLDQLKAVYEYALKNFSSMKSEVSSGHYGGGSDHDGYYVGQDFQTTHQGVVTRYKDREVIVTWNEVKDFMEDMVTQDNQITMFELLLEGAEEGYRE